MNQHLTQWKTFSMFACSLACLNAGSRMMLSFGRDGYATVARFVSRRAGREF